MKMLLPFLLVFVAPVGDFLGSYCGGRGFIPRGTGFIIGAASMLLLPFLMSVVIAVLAVKSLPQRTLKFVTALIIQFAVIFMFVPPGARSEMIGIGHRFRNPFQISEIRSCAEVLLQKHQNGNLTTNTSPPYLSAPGTSARFFVSATELPASLQNKFRYVCIDVSEQGSKVIFEVEPKMGIICGTNSGGIEFFYYKMADNVYAYRYQRL